MKWLLTALLAGLFAAGPFLTTRALGTKEAYNYSLAVADAVTQFRAAEVPMLVGQTEFAFNGRVHPLRTAPAFVYAASLLDVFTFRQLSFWTLQNLVLALSLVAAAGTCYWSLRAVTPGPPSTAAGLAGIFVMSPPVLAAAYGMDLYMTVLAVPFVPLVIAANVAAFTDRDRHRSFLLGVALGGAWLAHPPVALWLCIVTLLLQATALIVCRPSWAGLARSITAGLLLLVLAGYGFVAALTASPYGDIVHQHDTSLLLSEVKRVAAASFRPVSARADSLGDFQAGYTVWGLAILGLGGAFARRSASALLLLSTGAVLLLFTLPVPVVHAWLWDQVPTLVLNLTNQWPMQRLYLPFTALAIFAFALTFRRPTGGGRLVQDAMRLGLIVAVGWTLWQGWRFIGRGYATRQGPEITAVSHLPTNLDLTPISYALLGAPPDFINGTMDPAFGFRLLAPYDARPITANTTAALPATTETVSLRLDARPGESDDILSLTGRVTLQPSRRYRLTFDFLASAQPATFQIRGATIRREYDLPSAGGPHGFGMANGNGRVLSLWTDQIAPEEVNFRLVGPGIARSPWRGRPFAQLRVESIDPGALPIELQSLLPLRVRVRAPQAGYLETPRMFLPGYTALVNGQPARVQRSPERRTMLPVPAGASVVEIRYDGPWQLHAAFWVSCVGWLGVAGWGAAKVGPQPWRVRWQAIAVMIVTTGIGHVRRFGRGTTMTILAVAVVAGASTIAGRQILANRDAIGPVRVRFVLPRGETNRQQPILVTGRPEAGMFVYVVYHDDEHVRIGVDSWGRFGFQSDPIHTDYFGEHEIIVEAGALYPANHSKLRDLPEGDAARLQRRLRVSFDGQILLEQDVDTHTAEPDDITVGVNRIGGSSCEPAFAGQILTVERLPIPGR